MALLKSMTAHPMRILLSLWIVASLAWIILIAGFVHRQNLVRNPIEMAEDFHWQFQDCLRLPHAPDASAADLMVSKNLCFHAHRSGLRRHLGQLVIPPVAGLGVVLMFGWLRRRRRLG